MNIWSLSAIIAYVDGSWNSTQILNDENGYSTIGPDISRHPTINQLLTNIGFTPLAAIHDPTINNITYRFQTIIVEDNTHFYVLGDTENIEIITDDLTKVKEALSNDTNFNSYFQLTDSEDEDSEDEDLPTPTIYYKLEEDTGSSRIESVGTGLNLTIANGNPIKVAGKIGFGAFFDANTSDSLTTVANSAFNIVNEDYYIAAWLKASNLGAWLGDYICITNATIIFSIYGSFGSDLYVSIGDGTSIIFTTLLSVDTADWVFIEAAYRASDRKVMGAVQNSAWSVSGDALLTPLSVSNSLLIIGNAGGFGGSVGYGSVDELMIIKGSIPTDEQRAALFNGGAGVTYPFS